VPRESSCSRATDDGSNRADSRSCLRMEGTVSGILDKFHVEHGIHGARVLARSLQLTSFLDDERDIESTIDMLKDDLDACAREMKRLTRLNSRGALFEGWNAEA
jgi:hypothetical protein